MAHHHHAEGENGHMHGLFPRLSMPLKVFLVATLVVFFCILGVGLHTHDMSENMMKKGFSWNEEEHGAHKMMKCEHRGWGEEKENCLHMVKWFGNITQVQGNKITMTDNSGKAQTVLSQSSTSIFNATGEVGLATVKAGMNIVVVGSLNSSNQVEAALMKIL